MATKTLFIQIDNANHQLIGWPVDGSGNKTTTDPSFTLSYDDLVSIAAALPAGSPTLDIRFRQLKFKDPTSSPTCAQVQIVLLCSQVIQGW